MKPKIAELERQLDRGDSCSPHSGCADAYRRAALPALLRLARAAKAMSMCATLHFGEDRELMFDLDAALDAFDWGDK